MIEKIIEKYKAWHKKEVERLHKERDKEVGQENSSASYSAYVYYNHLLSGMEVAYIKTLDWMESELEIETIDKECTTGCDSDISLELVAAYVMFLEDNNPDRDIMWELQDLIKRTRLLEKRSNE